jgi:protein-arginine kinase activator protein McsA
MFESKIQQKTVKILKPLTSLSKDQLFTKQNLLAILKGCIINLNFESGDLVVKFLNNLELYAQLQERKLASIEIEDYEDAIVCRDTQKDLTNEKNSLKV